MLLSLVEWNGIGDGVNNYFVTHIVYQYTQHTHERHSTDPSLKPRAIERYLAQIGVLPLTASDHQQNLRGSSLNLGR